MTEVGDESPTGFEASRYFSNQHGCTSANSLNSICCSGGLLLPRVPMEGSSVGADPIALRHSGRYCGDRAQPFFLRLELRSVPPGPGPLPRLSELPAHVFSGLAGCSLPTPRHLLGAAWTAAGSWHQWTSTQERAGCFL